MKNKLSKYILLTSLVSISIAAFANTIACYQAKGDKKIWSSWQSQICVCDSNGAYDCAQSARVTTCTKQTFTPNNCVQTDCKTEEAETGENCHYTNLTFHVKQYLAAVTCPTSAGCGTYSFDQEWDAPYTTVDKMINTDLSGTNNCESTYE
jgi:hypothetical protein